MLVISFVKDLRAIVGSGRTFQQLDKRLGLT